MLGTIAMNEQFGSELNQGSPKHFPVSTALECLLGLCSSFLPSSFGKPSQSQLTEMSSVLLTFIQVLQFMGYDE